MTNSIYSKNLASKNRDNVFNRSLRNHDGYDKNKTNQTNNKHNIIYKKSNKQMEDILTKMNKTKHNSSINSQYSKPLTNNGLYKNMSFIDQYNKWLLDGVSKTYDEIREIYNFQDLDFVSNSFVLSPNFTFFWLYSNLNVFCVFPSYNNLTPEYYRSIYVLEEVNGRVNVKLNKILSIKSVTKVSKLLDNTFKIIQKGVLICSE